MMRIVATGDSFITRRLARTEALDRLRALIHAAEARFTNFEAVTPSADAIPNAVSGGTWARAPKGVVLDLADLGFNLIGWANNHTLDFCHGGIADTAAALEEAGLVHAGVGRNLAEAAAPRYLDCPSGRVALIAVTSTFHETAAAGQQRPDVPGRPGVNPLRFSTTWTLPQDRLAALDAIARECGINVAHEQRVKEGFGDAPEEGIALFGAHRFRAGDAGVHTVPKAADVARVTAAIDEARRQADIVLVSLHAHEQRGADKTRAAAFLEEFARGCIDAGAHAVIGHGPHVLRGIALHRGRPILYSLGNFIFHNETVENLPADFYEKYDMGLTERTADAIDKRSANNTRGFAANPWAWKSVIARFAFDGDRLAALDCVPVALGHGRHRARRGTPELTDDPDILRHLAALSAEYGTRIEIEDGMGRVALG